MVKRIFKPATAVECELRPKPVIKGQPYRLGRLDGIPIIHDPSMVPTEYYFGTRDRLLAGGPETRFFVVGNEIARWLMTAAITITLSGKEFMSFVQDAPFREH